MSDKVLLVEDEALLRQVVKHALLKDGLEVVEASTGEEAVKLIADGKPFDALVTDVQMPGKVDGIEVAEHARMANPNLPVVIMSGDTGGATIPELGQTGAFLPKPFRLATLVSLVRRLLSIWKTAGRAKNLPAR